MLVIFLQAVNETSQQNPKLLLQQNDSFGSYLPHSLPTCSRGATKECGGLEMGTTRVSVALEMQQSNIH